MSSSPPKEEPEAVKKEDSNLSPIVETPKAEEKLVKPFQELNDSSVEAEAVVVKEIPIEVAIEEEKESTKDTDKPSAEGNKEGIKGIDLENKEVDTKIHESQDNEGKDSEHRGKMC